MIIYQVINKLNGKSYIGQTIQPDFVAEYTFTDEEWNG